MRELRQKINNPRRAKDIADYDAIVAEWGSNITKLVSHRGSDVLPTQEDLLEAYYNIFLDEVLTFARLKIDDSFDPDGFREEMEKHIYRQIREAKISKAPLANILKDYQETFDH